MTIQIDNGDILIGQVDSDFYEAAKSWNMMRWSKKDRALRGKLSLPLLNKIATVRTLPPKFEEFRQKLAKKQAAIDAERENKDPAPILQYPVKATLFRHQIRGANMSVLAFEWVQREEEE